MSSPAYKRATDSFYQLWGNLKNNVTQQTQLKAAIYNFVIVAVVASCVAVCLVLGPFLKPLLWALLVGAVLFPFKYRLASSLKCWFQRLEDENTNLLVGIALAPLEAIESFGEYLWTSFMNHMQLLIGGTVGLLALRLFVAYAPKGIFCLAWRYIRWVHTLCGSFLSSLDYKIVRSVCRGTSFQRNTLINSDFYLPFLTQVIVILIIYISFVILFWNEEKSLYFMLIGQSLWIVLLAYVCSFLGALQVPVWIACLAYAAVGFVYNSGVHEDGDETNADEQNRSILDKCAQFWGSPILISTPNRLAVQPSSHENIDSIARNDPNVDPAAILKQKLDLNIKATETGCKGHQLHFAEVTKTSQSAIYFKGLFLACLITILYKQLFVLCLSLIPVLVYIVHNAIEIFGIKNYAAAKLEEIGKIVQDWIVPRHSALLPLCMPGVIKLNVKAHKYIRIALTGSIDTASSIIMIILLIFIVTFAGVFCAVEIYAETITVVQLGSDVVNYTINHRPELMDMFPEGKLHSLVSDQLKIKFHNNHSYRNRNAGLIGQYHRECLSIWTYGNRNVSRRVFERR